MGQKVMKHLYEHFLTTVCFALLHAADNSEENSEQQSGRDKNTHTTLFESTVIIEPTSHHLNSSLAHSRD